MCSSTKSNSSTNDRVPAETASTLYFVVFPCNAPPIFHSNRIPIPENALPYTPGDVLYLGPAEEVTQQKLQELAFPLAFGSKSAVTPHGPLWSFRVESVRKMGGLQYMRLMIASTFVVSVASESVGMRTMQTKYAAVALVITCPSGMPHYNLLLDNFDSVMRQLLHISLDFAMGATQLFFFKLSRTLTAQRLAAHMEKHPSAVLTYHTLAAVLVNAFTHKYSIPRIHGGAGVLNIDSEYGSSLDGSQAGEISVNSLVHNALCVLWRFSEQFATSVVAGLLTVSDWENYGLVSHNCKYGDHQDKQAHQSYQEFDDDDDVCSDYRKGMGAGEKSTLTSPELIPSSDRDISSIDVAQRNNWYGASESNTVTSSLDFAAKYSQESTDARGVISPPGTTATCSLNLNRRGRVVIFSTDPLLARSILAIAAFFFRDSPVAARCTGSSSSAAPFAAKVQTCAHSSVPVQWVAQEYDPRTMDELLCSPHTVENLVLIIAPCMMMCRRLRLVKTFSTNPVLVEKFREHFHPVRPFHFQLVDSEEIVPDDAVRAALKGALFLQKKSGGAVNCVDYLEAFIVHIVRRSCLSHRFPQLQEGEMRLYSSCDSPIKKNAPTLNSSSRSFWSLLSFSSILRSRCGGGLFRFSQSSKPESTCATAHLAGTVFPANCPSPTSSVSVTLTHTGLGGAQVGPQLMRLLTECSECVQTLSLRSVERMCAWD